METCKHGSGAGFRKPAAAMRQGVECRAYEESVGQQVGMKLDGNFMDVFRYIAIVFPSVLQVGIGHQYQFLFVYLLDRVTHNALCSFGVLNEIQFTLGMYMDRKIKVRFLALYQNETILG